MALLTRLSNVIAICAGFICFAVAGSNAQEPKFFTIGTGGTAYTYHPVGGMIANAISKPPGSRECGEGGSCGVDNMIAVAVSSRGSLDNINAIVSGERNSGFAQSDVAYWAYTGTGTMEGEKPAAFLRTITALYEEHVHLVTLKSSGINNVSDLKGKRVSLDERGSGTYVDATLIMQSNGIYEEDITVSSLRGNAASQALLDGEIDAFFVVTGYPTDSLVDLASRAEIKLVPIDGAAADALTEEYAFFAVNDIPEGTYEGVGATSTVSVGALWVTSSKEKSDLVYEITKALWHKESRKLLDVGHAKGEDITLDTALFGVGVPLHPGAEKFYKEIGALR